MKRIWIKSRRDETFVKQKPPQTQAPSERDRFLLPLKVLDSYVSKLFLMKNILKITQKYLIFELIAFLTAQSVSLDRVGYDWEKIANMVSKWNNYKNLKKSKGLTQFYSRDYCYYFGVPINTFLQLEKEKPFYMDFEDYSETDSIRNIIYNPHDPILDYEHFIVVLDKWIFFNGKLNYTPGYIDLSFLSHEFRISAENDLLTNARFLMDKHFSFTKSDSAFIMAMYGIDYFPVYSDSINYEITTEPIQISPYKTVFLKSTICRDPGEYAWGLRYFGIFDEEKVYFFDYFLKTTETGAASIGLKCLHDQDLNFDGIADLVFILKGQGGHNGTIDKHLKLYLSTPVGFEKVLDERLCSSHWSDMQNCQITVNGNSLQIERETYDYSSRSRIENQETIFINTDNSIRRIKEK